MKKDLYENLGVSENATQEDIKTAYRNLAKEHHPDKPTGDKEKFQQVQLAYSILGNEDKRSRYDKTGTTGKPNFDSVLNGYVNSILEEVINSTKQVDIVDFLKQVTIKNIENMDKALDDTKKKEEKIKKIIESYKIKSSADVITPILNDKIKMIQMHQENIKEEKQTMQDIYDVISGYDYEYTPQFVSPSSPTQPAWMGGFSI